MEIRITVRDKIARSPWETIVCGNSGYTINFDFDEEWNSYKTKTALFVYGGTYTDVVFDGNICNVPVLTNATSCAVGVFAGDLQTTTPALIDCMKSILCDGGAPADPSPDVYAQIMEKLNNMDNGKNVLRVDFHGNIPTVSYEDIIAVLNNGGIVTGRKDGDSDVYCCSKYDENAVYFEAVNVDIENGTIWKNTITLTKMGVCTEKGDGLMLT